MNVQEYADLVIFTRDNLFNAMRAALPAECEMEKRNITTGTQNEDGWVAALVNRETNNIRILIMLMNNLRSTDEEATSGAKNFKPSIRLTFELFHDYLQGTDAENSEAEFEADALKLQFAIETNKSLPPLAMIDRYDISLGIRRSKVRPMHYARGEIVINFRSIRYDS